MVLTPGRLEWGSHLHSAVLPVIGSALVLNSRCLFDREMCPSCRSRMVETTDESTPVDLDVEYRDLVFQGESPKPLLHMASQCFSWPAPNISVNGNLEHLPLLHTLEVMRVVPSHPRLATRQ